MEIKATANKGKTIFSSVKTLSLKAVSEVDGSRMAALFRFLTKGGLVNREDRPTSVWLAGVLVELKTEVKDGVIVAAWLEMTDQHIPV